jgi:hypothetical protein
MPLNAETEARSRPFDRFDEPSGAVADMSKPGAAWRTA